MGSFIIFTFVEDTPPVHMHDTPQRYNNRSTGRFFFDLLL
jgi:hypothetical protein